MAVAADLIEAASLTLENLYALWVVDDLSARVTDFAAALFVHFPDDDQNNQPIGNWLAVIAAFAPTINDFSNGGASVGLSSISTYQQAVDYVYRLCKFAAAYRDLNLISAAQVTALLAAYNAQFS